MTLIRGIYQFTKTNLVLRSILKTVHVILEIIEPLNNRLSYIFKKNKITYEFPIFEEH
jgi:hypothetical protein